MNQTDPLCIGNGQTNQPPSDLVGALNCMHDQQAVLTYQFAVTPTGINRGQRMLSCYGGVRRVRRLIKTITKALVHGPERSVKYWL
jgi:hypothetical protein